jgi:hypothetical protein
MALSIVNRLINSTTDANGSFSSGAITPSPTKWAALKLTAQTSGPAVWVVRVGGSLRGHGRSDRVDIPLYVQPAEQVSFTIMSAQSLASVNGTLAGLSGDSLTEIAPYISLAPSTISVNSNARINVTALVTQSFLATDVICHVSDTSVFAVGDMVVFFQTPGGASSFPAQVNSIQADASTITLAAPTGFQFNPGDTCQVQPEIGINSSTPILVTQDSNSVFGPAYLHARSSASVRTSPGALNTDFTIVPAVAGTIVLVHSVELNTNAGATWEVALWDGPSATGTKIATLFVDGATSVGVFPPATWDGKGRRLSVGNPLVGTLVTGPAAATIFGTVGFTQQ